MVKNAKEISHIRHACQITDLCFSTILKFISPSITEKEIATQLEKLFSKYNVKPAFPPIVAFGKNTSFVHHVKASSNVRCRKQEIILLDFGAKADGYCSDMTRMVFVGEPKPEWKKSYLTVLQAQHVPIAALQDQVEAALRLDIPVRYSGASLDKLARHVLHGHHLPEYPHSLGHNLGQQIHELPKLTIKKDAWILPGMVFTIEPGTYIKGDYGIRIEDTVLLKEDGIEVLTQSTKNLIQL